MRHLFVLAAVALGFVVATTSCAQPSSFEIGTDEIRVFVQERCANMATCCGAAERTECEQRESAMLASLAEFETPLVFSQDCYAQIVAEAAAAGCGNDVDTCRLAHGSGRQGDACVVTGASFYFVDTCANDLICYSGRCVDDPFFAPQRGGLGDFCSPFERCEYELFCTEEQVCVVDTVIGESCTQQGECEGGNKNFCEIADGICVEGRVRDEACREDFECAVECSENDSCTKLACYQGRCQSQPPAVCVLVE